MVTASAKSLGNVMSDLMDAKAKVVAVVVDALDLGMLIPSWVTDADNPFPVGTELVLATDHEAALAEQAKRHAATEIDACNWASRASAAEQRLAQLQDELSNARRANTTLRSGLEALAGELSDMAGGDPPETPFEAGVIHAYRYMEGQLRTLASSATGEKNTEEAIP